MAALTQAKDTPHKFKVRIVAQDVAASTQIHAGSVVASNAAGYIVPASDATGLTVVGRAEESVDNTAGIDGEKEVRIAIGVFKVGNAGSNSVDQADLNKEVYVSDDQTAIKVAGAAQNIVMGKLQEIDPDGGLWVGMNL